MTIARKGDRIRLVAMSDDPDPIQTGEMGTVDSVSYHYGGRDSWHQIDVTWDNGRTLMLVSPPDMFEIIGSEDATGLRPTRNVTATN